MFGRVEEITLTVIPTTIFSPSLFFLSNLSLLLFSLRLEREKKRNAMFPVRSIFFLSLVSVVLLDTTQEEKLEWTKYPFGAEANTPGVSFAIVPISTWRSSYFMTRGVASRFSRSSSATWSGRLQEEGREEKKKKFFAAYCNFRGDKMDTARRQEERGLGEGRERYQKHFMVSVRAAYVGSRWPVRSLRRHVCFSVVKRAAGRQTGLNQPLPPPPPSSLSLSLSIVSTLFLSFRTPSSSRSSLGPSLLPVPVSRWTATHRTAKRTKSQSAG